MRCCERLRPPVSRRAVLTICIAVCTRTAPARAMAASNTRSWCAKTVACVPSAARCKSPRLAFNTTTGFMREIWRTPDMNDGAFFTSSIYNNTSAV